MALSMNDEIDFQRAYNNAVMAASAAVRLQALGQDRAAMATRHLALYLARELDKYLERRQRIRSGAQIRREAAEWAELIN
jgi:hypothetical protein